MADRKFVPSTSEAFRVMAFHSEEARAKRPWLREVEQSGPYATVAKARATAKMKREAKTYSRSTNSYEPTFGRVVIERTATDWQEIE